MSRRTAAIVLSLLLTAAAALAASLEQAWDLYLAGDLDAAQAELAPLLADGEAAERAGALSLAGSVAAAHGDYAAARRFWTAAAESFPDEAAGREAAAKIDLLCAVVDCPEEGGAVAPAPPPAPPPPAPVPPTSTVLVAGQGVPYDAVREAVAFLTEVLRQDGVDAQSPTAEIAVVERSEVVVGQLLDAARDRGAASVLVLDAQFGFRERAQVTCWNADGAVLWSESVVGGTGLVRPVRMNRNLMERLHAKLAARLNGPGLPVSH